MEDKHIYDKVNLIDRYDLTCAKNDLELKINETNNEIEYIEDKLSDLIVEFKVYKNDILEDILMADYKNKMTNSKLDDIKKNLHLNIMCLDDDIMKIKKEMVRHDFDKYIILFIVFVFHSLIYLFS